ncbi:hypothetical protein ES703_72474 [subsurface metagenome]
MLDELDGCFAANTVDTGYVIRGIAYQSFKVDDMLRLNTVSLSHSCFIIDYSITEGAPGFRVKYIYLGRYQLHGIGITGNDYGINALLAGLIAQCAENVIRLVAIKLIYWNMEGFNQLPYPPELINQLIGSRWTLRLILVIHLVPEGRGFSIKSDSVTGGFQLIYYLEQYLGKAENSSHNLARFRYCKHRWRFTGLEGVVSTVHYGMTIEQHQKRLFHKPIITSLTYSTNNSFYSIYQVVVSENFISAFIFFINLYESFLFCRR